MTITRSIVVAATGTHKSGSGTLLGARLAPGSDAATAVLRDGGASGAILAKLAAPATGPGDELRVPIYYETDLHVTLTGTSPIFNVFE